MEITESKIEQVKVLGLKGRLDAATSNSAQDRFSQLIDLGETKLVVDLSELDYLSSAGLRVFMMAAKRLKARGGKLVLCRAPDRIKEILEIARLSELFFLCPSLEEALTRFA